MNDVTARGWKRPKAELEYEGRRAGCAALFDGGHDIEAGLMNLNALSDGTTFVAKAS
ncbi:hypothetical protein HKX23_18065 [Sulfitobacter sp. KE29]|uniref:hypothetical protein n=1 Tax=unclassified Sulfitobacter TaxID=196795 RepID=UPI0023E2CA8B|nr:MULTISPECIES: hypothetical protein [unclassified Sulfitobacter]MDF3420257.1 hypothetical protein [Sulfitobacter sp. Ks38]MDF3427742.1 hypothetical protein [Sulfitobacter sp. KE29]MDF3431321.1 hypothetical protein [Sulfitobacter sp. S46]MDF3446095.1 hypothetical protein [Sulfitobacter sp. KE31]MDF3550103.1 hypothetical protein [Sulfitobacter sp. KE28]